MSFKNFFRCPRLKVLSAICLYKMYAMILLSFIIITVSYWILGISLVSKPSTMLFVSESLSNEVKTILQEEGLYFNDSPRVYILPRIVRTFFFLPYSSAQKKVGRLAYTNQLYQSYIVVEDDSIVIQEEEVGSLDVLAHEAGHYADYHSDPERFSKKSITEAENFALSFQVRALNKRERNALK